MYGYLQFGRLARMVWYDEMGRALGESYLGTTGILEIVLEA